MEFVNGVKEKRVLDIREVLEWEYEGKEIRMNGAVHHTPYGRGGLRHPAQVPGAGAVCI